MIQYTSGTTGFPKGALLTHRGITNNARISALIRGAGSGTIDITAMPLFHTGGCVVSVLGTHSTYGSLVLMPEFEPNLFLDLIDAERVQFTLAVPTMLIDLLEAQRAHARDLSTLAVVISGGAVVPIEIVRRVKTEFGCDFSIIFGQTETSPMITMTRLDDSAEDTAHSLGRPIPCCEVKIVDPASGRTLPVGESGEFLTRGFHTMKGYFDMPEATAKTIDADGWLHTGDLCSMDARGYCYVKGRLKDMIIRGGENIYPREIEDVLFRHPAVAEVAVVGVPDQRWGEQVAAFVRTTPGHTLEPNGLHDFVREHLAPHKTPKIWVGVASYPLTPSGKIQKYRLAEMFASGELKPVSS
jgi:fatty-acyl-CoA synthase